MQKEDVREELEREPFVPLRIHLKSGKRYDIPHNRVAHFLGYGVLVFIGLKENSVQAKGYDRFPFEEIERIEQRPAKSNGQKRRKAS